MCVSVWVAVVWGVGRGLGVVICLCELCVWIICVDGIVGAPIV